MYLQILHHICVSVLGKEKETLLLRLGKTHKKQTDTRQRKTLAIDTLELMGNSWRQSRVIQQV